MGTLDHIIEQTELGRNDDPRGLPDDLGLYGYTIKGMRFANIIAIARAAQLHGIDK